MNERQDRTETAGGMDEAAGGTDLRSGESSEASPSVSSRVGGAGSEETVSERLMDTGPSMGSDSGLDTETSARSETLFEEQGGTRGARGSVAESQRPEAERPELGQSEP